MGFAPQHISPPPIRPREAAALAERLPALIGSLIREVRFSWINNRAEISSVEIVWDFLGEAYKYKRVNKQ